MKKLTALLLAIIFTLTACAADPAPEESTLSTPAPTPPLSTPAPDPTPEPATDIDSIANLSAKKWLENTFSGYTEDYRCTKISVYDIAEDRSVFCYEIGCEFTVGGGEPPAELMAGNTKPAEEDGWYSFTRQIRVERDGEAWEVTNVGTGGVSVEGVIEAKSWEGYVDVEKNP